VFDSHDRHDALIIIDAVDHAIVSAPGAVQALEAELERIGDATWALAQ
jgi:hypothetical protein